MAKKKTPPVADIVEPSPEVEKLTAHRTLKKLGVESLITERQSIKADIAMAQATLDKLNAKIMSAFIEAGISKAEVAGYPVSMVVDSVSRTLDKDKMTRYLVDHKVDPRLLAKAIDYATTTTPRKPYLTVGKPHES